MATSTREKNAMEIPLAASSVAGCAAETTASTRERSANLPAKGRATRVVR
jgi:hypothetical protein